MPWPRSKGKQAAIAVVGASLAAFAVLSQIAMESFNHFYFPPHNAYPYPYATEWAARLAMYRDCGLTFVGAFLVLMAIQRRFPSTGREDSN